MTRETPPKRPKAKPNRRRLNDRFVKSVKPSDKRTLYWDTVQAGLVLQVEPTGHKAYKLYYRFGDRPRWFHIENARAIGLKAARAVARAKRNEVTENKTDVQAEKLTARRADTFAELANRYREECAKLENKSWQQGDYLVRRNVLPKLGAQPFARPGRDSRIHTVRTGTAARASTFFQAVSAFGCKADMEICAVNVRY